MIQNCIGFQEVYSDFEPFEPTALLILKKKLTASLRIMIMIKIKINRFTLFNLFLE